MQKSGGTLPDSALFIIAMQTKYLSNISIPPYPTLELMETIYFPIPKWFIPYHCYTVK